MIKNYFKIAWRNLLKNRVFSLINVIGLAVSMSVCLLILAIIADQKSYDQFHTNKNRVYRILSTGKNNNDMSDMASTAIPLSEELRKNFTGIESSATLVTDIGGDIFYKEKIASGGGYFADENLFKILDFKLLEGDPKMALSNPKSLVISQELASQLFFNENPVGKTVTFKDTDLSPTGVNNGNRETDYGLFTITGVLKPLEGKTHLPFKILASMSSINALVKDSVINIAQNDWNSIWANYTYVLLKEGKTEADLQQMLDKISDKYYPKGDFNQYGLKAQALNKITPSNPIGNETHVSVPEIVLLVLGVLCLIVMLSACLNYTNLSVARSLNRAKEVGIRKVSGATRKQIFGQFIAESVLISMVSLVFSILILFLLQYLFSGLVVNKYLHITFEHTVPLYLTFVGFSLGVGLIAGMLPSLYISAFNPIQILKNFSGTKMFKRLTLRKALLVMQFSVSLIFIISTTLIYLQTDHIFNFDYGFNKDNVINVTLYKQDNYKRFAQEISTNKNIIAVSACAYSPASGTQNTTIIKKTENLKDSLRANYFDIDAKSVDVWDLKLLAGKNLPEIPSLTGESYILVNEKLVDNFKFGSASQAIGQKILVDGNNVEIVGVVKDFQFLNVMRAIEPLMLRNRQSQLNFASVRVTGTNQQETVKFLEEAWKKVNPTTKFQYAFLDQELLLVHTMFSNIANVLGFIAFLAVFISCLGLLGMATYTAETRRKEMGIRKVLGSGVFQIILLLSKNYVYMIGIAVLIATPLAYFINNLWLEFFVSRVSISPAVLLLGISILLTISLLTVLSQAWRAAKLNPVESLKAE
ncbi:ABC transporter permease [Lacihabitans soyangensis]|uniref:ABC transporter permease n=1 Tax=Lacihabitans soyangensis TaxID=869394 RepID=A0AAE3H6P5_9BACT|nr:ABC transporter permease [Lacihabitans soyangensis]MCP9765913.1 ABC transporter permease [Lacihabitans soyangensis]